MSDAPPPLQEEKSVTADYAPPPVPAPDTHTAGRECNDSSQPPTRPDTNWAGLSCEQYNSIFRVVLIASLLGAIVLGCGVSGYFFLLIFAPIAWGFLGEAFLSEEGAKQNKREIKEQLSRQKMKKANKKMREREKAAAERERQKKIVCPHCRQAGHIHATRISRDKGIHGGKTTAAVLTAGWSMLVTKGLSRKEDVTEFQCSNCGTTWHAD
jgi:hypothetical protein